MTRLFLKPAPGRVVRRPAPDGRPLDAGGAFVPDDVYWRRRIADGDAVAAKPPAAPKSQKAEG
jgi:hypothetical protein